MRIVYNNLANTNLSSITSSELTVAGFPATNLLKPNKYEIWKTADTTAYAGSDEPQLVLTFNSKTTVGCVALLYTNLPTNSTITIKGFDNNTQIYTYTVNNRVLGSDITQLSSNMFIYYGANHAVIWLPENALIQPVNKIKIFIAAQGVTGGIIEAAHIVTGSYWEPTHNTEFGVSTKITDNTEVYRTSGVSVVNIKSQIKSITFNLSWLTSTERSIWDSITRSVGLHTPVLVSVFPDDGTDKETQYTLFGRFNDLADVSYNNPFFHSTSASIDEI